MELETLNTERSAYQKLLNLGCGRQFHRAWINVDLEAVSEEVREHDITKGLPFDEHSMDAVYHSHVLEHLKPADGRVLLEECFRVLKPGGVLRIVVPDLERIARLYLDNHQKAMAGQAGADINYNWMKLELLDQLVRETSGGQMGRYMAAEEIKNSNFVQHRVGDEFWVCRTLVNDSAKKQSVLRRLRKIASTWRLRMAKFCVRGLLGREAVESFEEGIFRSSGEIHRWMYDRYSLKSLCHELGFEQFRVCGANESQIDEFGSYQLDSCDGRVRKPDSLFVECEKPRLAISQRRAA